MKEKSKNLNFKITVNGSLGLLAYGDIGLREWRKVKKAMLDRQKGDYEKK